MSNPQPFGDIYLYRFEIPNTKSSPFLFHELDTRYDQRSAPAIVLIMGPERKVHSVFVKNLNRKIDAILQSHKDYHAFFRFVNPLKPERFQRVMESHLSYRGRI